MRHGKKINHLSRKSAHRKSMLANMACSLIEHKRINTTTAKAKALRTFVEPLITKSKTDTTHNRRIVFSKIRDKYAVTELFREVAPKVASRPGGYTRIIKLGHRLGDAADMAMIELVDFNDLYNPKGKKKKKSTRRAGKKTSLDSDVQTETPQENEDKVEVASSENEVKKDDKQEEPKAEDQTKAEDDGSKDDEKQ